MLKVVTRCTVAHDKTLEFRSIAARYILATKKERGCLDAGLFQDVKEENIFSLIEEWHDGEALAAHMQAPHVKVIMTDLGKLQIEEPRMNVYRSLR